jgi:hypothetical protein
MLREPKATRFGITSRARSVMLAFLVFSTIAATLAAHPPPQDQTSAQPNSGTQPASSGTAGGAMAGMPGMDQNMNPATSGGQPWCQDNVWSTLNHRVSGWFLLFWGLTALLAGLQWPRRTWWRFAPPMMLFGLAEFLFFRNDPETWPVGPKSFWATMHNAEDFQHRVFLLLIILIALVELLRAADRLPDLAAKYALPALGGFGAVYLFFHKHGGPEMAAMMDHPQQPGMVLSPGMQQMMASMKLVRHEHLWFSLFGFGLVAAKLLADTGHLKGRWGATLWSVFAVFLGGYMIGYIE